jgi:hypothetical protein
MTREAVAGSRGIGVNGDKAGLAAEEPLSPREALALVESQRDRVNQSLQVNVALVHGALGVAWLAGFGIFYFTFGHGAGKSPEVPVWVAVVVIGVVNIVALMAGLGQTLRRGRGIEGRSWDAMRMYLWAWPLAYAGVYAADAGLQYQGLPERLAPLLWTGSAAAVTGVMCLAGGLFFRDKIHYTLGAWVLVTTAASMFAGVPGNFAVLALAGGGGFLIATWRYIVISRPARE